MCIKKCIYWEFYSDTQFIGRAIDDRKVTGVYMFVIIEWNTFDEHASLLVQFSLYAISELCIAKLSQNAQFYLVVSD